MPFKFIFIPISEVKMRGKKLFQDLNKVIFNKKLLALLDNGGNINKDILKAFQC